MLWQHRAWGERSLSGLFFPLDMIRPAAGVELRVKSCSCQLSESSQPKTYRANSWYGDYLVTLSGPTANRWHMMLFISVYFYIRIYFLFLCCGKRSLKQDQICQLIIYNFYFQHFSISWFFPPSVHLRAELMTVIYLLIVDRMGRIPLPSVIPLCHWLSTALSCPSSLWITSTADWCLLKL